MQSMRYLRTNTHSLLGALQPVLYELDHAWWYLAGIGSSLTSTYLKRMGERGWSREQIESFWHLSMDSYLDHGDVYYVGTPGYLSQLGDTAIFEWTTLFVIESVERPDSSLDAVHKRPRNDFGPHTGLPDNVVLVVRDIDHAYQDYGFRDSWMFDAVQRNLQV